MARDTWHTNHEGSSGCGCRRRAPSSAALARLQTTRLAMMRHIDARPALLVLFLLSLGSATSAADDPPEFEPQLLLQEVTHTLHIHRPEPKYVNPNGPCSTTVDVTEQSTVEDILEIVGQRLEFPCHRLEWQGAVISSSRLHRLPDQTVLEVFEVPPPPDASRARELRRRLKPASGLDTSLKWVPCGDGKSFTASSSWFYAGSTQQLLSLPIQQNVTLCLAFPGPEVVPPPPRGWSPPLVVEQCDHTSPLQRWMFKDRRLQYARKSAPPVCVRAEGESPWLNVSAATWPCAATALKSELVARVPGRSVAPAESVKLQLHMNEASKICLSVSYASSV
jgi:hypothetical protein